MEVLSLIDVSVEDDLLYDLASPAPSHPDPPHVGEVFRPHLRRISLGGTAGLVPSVSIAIRGSDGR